jgi:hypothetical protein
VHNSHTQTMHRRYKLQVGFSVALLPLPVTSAMLSCHCNSQLPLAQWPTDNRTSPACTTPEAPVVLPSPPAAPWTKAPPP